MGGCLSSYIGGSDYDFDLDAPATAKVISTAGEMHGYNLPVRVWNVLEAESPSSSSSVFLCNSDRLCYDEHIPALRSEVELVSDQIYFVLPRSRQKQKLSASDMAGLAVKASVALHKANKKDGMTRKRWTQISPVVEVLVRDYEQEEENGFEVEDDRGHGSSSDSRGSLKKAAPPARKTLQKSPSRRLKRAMRSFRIRLSTIYEEI